MKKSATTFILSFVFASLSSLALAKEDSKFMRVKANPIALAFLGIHAGVDFKVHDKVSLGVLGSYINSQGVRTWATGVQGNFSLGHSAYTDGFSLRTKLYYTNHFMTKSARSKVEALNKSSLFPVHIPKSSHVGNAALELVHEWFWDNGFNVNLGLGTTYSTENIIRLSGELSLGLAL